MSTSKFNDYKEEEEKKLIRKEKKYQELILF